MQTRRTSYYSAADLGGADLVSNKLSPIPQTFVETCHISLPFRPFNKFKSFKPFNSIPMPVQVVPIVQPLRFVQDVRRITFTERTAGNVWLSLFRSHTSPLFPEQHPTQKISRSPNL